MARDKFREAPVPGIPHISHGDVESCFAALITLYHIRKLLSSHGIRPAYEMLEEKLQEGYVFTFNIKDIVSLEVALSLSLFAGHLLG